MDNKIKNTTQESNTPEGARSILVEAMVDSMLGKSPSAFIERMEAQGQSEFVNSEVLPVNFGYKKEGKEALEKAGVVFGEVVEGDPIFCYVTLPAGWKKVPTDHSMWSKLLDEKGRKRAAIFYKSAFYDRSAHVSVLSRYSYGYEPVGGWGTISGNEEEITWIGYVKEFETNIVFQTESKTIRSAQEDSYRQKEALERLAEDWINEHFPDWHNPFAYWDED